MFQQFLTIIGFLFLCECTLVKFKEVTELKNSQNQKPLRIINGEITTIDKFPFLVSLQYNGTLFDHTVEHFCCGNIIHPIWIVTSAQCINSRNVESFHIRAGSTNYYEDGELYYPTEIVVHPNFIDPHEGFDIALIKLSVDITFNERIQAIKLPEPGTIIDDDSQFDIAGWGSIRQAEKMSDRLRKTEVTKVSKRLCETVYGIDSISYKIFCIYEEGFGPCVGDTGSPAKINDTLLGIASWSYSCGYTYPTVYTNISEMTNWIRDVTGINKTQRGSSATRRVLNMGLITIIFTLQSLRFLFP